MIHPDEYHGKTLTCVGVVGRCGDVLIEVAAGRSGSRAKSARLEIEASHGWLDT
nr:MAG TPA: hypothetical protein [Caudoviricetes sp.]